MQMAKKGKGKSKVAKAAGAALDALDDNPFLTGAGAADGLMPVAPEPIKKKAKKKKDKSKDPFAEAAEEEAAAPPAAPAAPKGPTMADKVKLICVELGVDASLPVAKAVGAANEAMGIVPRGSLPEQAARLLKEIGVV